MEVDPTQAYRPVAVTVRSGFPESVHHGAVVVLATDGSVALEVGDPGVAIYARSSTKPTPGRHHGATRRRPRQ